MLCDVFQRNFACLKGSCVVPSACLVNKQVPLALLHSAWLVLIWMEEGLESYPGPATWLQRCRSSPAEESNTIICNVWYLQLPYRISLMLRARTFCLALAALLGPRDLWKTVYFIKTCYPTKVMYNKFVKKKISLTYWTLGNGWMTYSASFTTLTAEYTFSLN